MLNSGLTSFRAQTEFEQSPLWAQTFGDAGYDTFITGKWHLSETALKRSFKELGPVSPGMFESGPDAYHRPTAGTSWTPWDTSRKGQWLHTKEWHDAGTNPSPDEIRHSAAIWADSAATQIRLASQRNNPFFLYVGFNSPHDPRQAPREFVERYPQNGITIPPNYAPEHPFDQGDHQIRDELLAPFPRTTEAVRLHRSEYYAHITYMDVQIGRILEALSQSGQAANTYVIFTADHGLAVGEHGLLGKQNLYAASNANSAISWRRDYLKARNCLYRLKVSRISLSTVTSGRSFWAACAIKSRSNGSLCRKVISPSLLMSW
jgi:choline-sulfatase